MKTYNCIHCDKKTNFGHSKSNKFCSVKCQADHRWEYETKPRVERGECSHNSRALKPYCHSQTDNFGSKGKGSRYKKVTKRNKYLQDYKASFV